jgi:pheromone shutdown protein TraB
MDPVPSSGTVEAGSPAADPPPMNADTTIALDLPRTVHLLDVAGKRVFLVGTAHVSTQSVDDVRTTIERVRPDSVCVELCQPRYESLTNPQAWRKLDILSVLREGKAHLLLGSLILTAFQRRIARQLGVVPGAEMVAAIESAREHGAQLVLADRRIEITLKRTTARLGGWTKIKALSNLLAGLFVPDRCEGDREAQGRGAAGRRAASVGARVPRRQGDADRRTRPLPGGEDPRSAR